jgi:L-lactate dehydrogenase
VLFPAVELRDGDYDDLEGAALVMITAGLNEKGGGATDRSDPQGRLRLLDKNLEIYKELVPRVHTAAPDAIVLVVTDPPDPLADAVRMLGHHRVLGTGTFLDSLRFRFHLGQRLGIGPAGIDAQILGEHGTSEVFIWSAARAGGVPVLDLMAPSGADRRMLRDEIERDVRFANISIIEGIGASQHGIGMAAARIAEIILRDERLILPIGSFSPRYGVTLSLPSVLGRDGIARVIDPDLPVEEREGLERSADALRKAFARIKI